MITVDQLLYEAAWSEQRGDHETAQRLLDRAIYHEKMLAERLLINQRRAERMGRQSDACMNHRNPQPDCPACL